MAQLVEPAPPLSTARALDIPPRWTECRFLTCSVLPVRMACNLSCKFCFSKSSISSLEHEPAGWTESLLERYFEFSRNSGASRLVITGGGEPLLRPKAVLSALRVGKRFFNEVALFTNGSFLDADMVRALSDHGLSYVCFSRHHHDDQANRALMGPDAIELSRFFDRVQETIKVRATCVLGRGYVESPEHVWAYIETLKTFRVREFTFKHTYVAYDKSLFGASSQNRWALENQIQSDPFHGTGELVAKLPWGPQIKRIAGVQVCYYYEPIPDWELRNRLCRSANLLTDGQVYASLEDQQSLLFTLTP
jgi:pyruvate-formate lyase-activating enzyme